MNERDRAEMDELAAAQRTLRQQLIRIDAKLDALRARLDAADRLRPAAAPSPEAAGEVVPSKLPADSEPPPSPPVSPSTLRQEKAESPRAAATPPPLPMRTARNANAAPDGTAATTAVSGAAAAAFAGVPAPATAPAATIASENLSSPAAGPPGSGEDVPASPDEPFELRLGTVWLVRTGIVILLTGLVFLGNYAYQNFIGRFGPAGKLALLYLCGAALGGAGLWLERSRAELRNYARVLIAGGFAAIYYATYAAHFVPRLRVIENPFVAGALLLVLAAGIAFIADRRRSQTLALGAVLLAYYTSAINPLGTWTLFSNLMLTGAAVFFLVRNRWTTVSFASLLATYTSYGYWRLYHENAGFLRALSREEFWAGALFLLGYWVLFTAGALLSRQGLSASQRAGFISLNNAAYFLFVATAMPGVYPQSFWIFALAFGGVLLALALAARRLFPDEPLLDGAYLAQGLLLVTVGLAARLTGYQLALVLALESAALVTCVRARHGTIYLAGAAIVAAVALVLAWEQIVRKPSLALPLGGTAAAAFLYNARWLKHLSATETRFDWRAAYFSLLALGLGLAMIRHAAAPPDRAMIFAAVALAITLGTVLHGLIELTALAQLYVFAAHALWYFTPGRGGLPWWNAPAVLLATVALNQWWQHQREEPRANLSAPLQLVYALGAAVLALVWLSPKFDADAWLLVVSGLAVGVLAGAIAARAWSFVIAAQLFFIVCIAHYVDRLGDGPHWRFTVPAIIAVALPGLLGGQFARLLEKSEHAGSVALLTLIYRGAALVMFIAWGFEYIPRAHQLAFFAFAALALFAVAAWLKKGEPLLMSAGLAAIALLKFWFDPVVPRSLLSPNTFALILMLSAQRLGPRWLDESRFPRAARNVVVTLLLATLWLHVSRWAATGERHFLLSIAWTLLATGIFAAGLFLRERAYRLAGFVILAVTVARVFVVDVWHLDTVYRIISFLLLGAVLMALGFVYNRFAAKFREWL